LIAKEQGAFIRGHFILESVVIAHEIVALQFRDGGIVALQYADDTVLFSSSDKLGLRNLRCILLLFEVVSGMRINFHKSEIVPMNMEESEAHDIAHVLNCPTGSFPIKYLGVPLHFEKA
jgi:hypothetical protein